MTVAEKRKPLSSVLEKNSFLEKGLSLLPFAWTRALAAELGALRESRIKELIASLDEQVDHLIGLGYHTYLGRDIERFNDENTYRQNCISAALKNLTVREVETNLREGRQPILVDERVGNYKYIAKKLGIDYRELERQKNISFGAIPADRGLCYLRANRESSVYVAWMSERNIGVGDKNSTYINVEDSLPSNERGANLLEVMSWLRENPDVPFTNQPLLIPGECFHSDKSGHRFLQPEDFHIPVINRNGELSFTSVSQTQPYKEEAYLTTKYNRSDLLVHNPPVILPRYW